MENVNLEESSYRFTGHERVLHNASATVELPKLLTLYGYQRVFVVCSRSINTKTKIAQHIRECLGEKLVGLTDDVGEHSPLSNVLKAAQAVRDSRADVIVSIGGGSVMDMCKAIQLCISEEAFDRDSLLRLQFVLSEDGKQMLTTSKASPRIRQIAIPTTLSTSEWTPVSSPLAIIYDPSFLSQTPLHLLLSTGVRGLDHAINTACSSSPHPFASVLAEKAIQLYMENLPLLGEHGNRDALSNCQLATWYTGMGQMSVPHGFSHWMVHIVGPYGGVPHSDAACVLMLAQAKWLEGWVNPQHDRLRVALGQSDQPFHKILGDFLVRLEMPTTLDDLGLSVEAVEKMIDPALQHPMVTRNNVRPIEGETDLRSIMSLAWRRRVFD
jgi:maleylacetate reductase